jgi:hypothetical protein
MRVGCSVIAGRNILLVQSAPLSSVPTCGGAIEGGKICPGSQAQIRQRNGNEGSA